MIYKKIGEFIHLILNPLPRKQTVLEFIYTSGGSWFENDLDRGKKHLLEHCIVSRTKDLDFQGFTDYQFAQNIAVNAYTGPLTMGLTFQGHRDDSVKMLDLMMEVAFNPTFDANILKQEKEIVLREISERRGEPSYRLHFSNMNKIYQKNSYETHEVLGESKLVEQTTLEDFNQLMVENLTKSHLIINLAGGFDAVEIEFRINEILVANKTLEKINPSLKDNINYHPGTKFNEFSFLPIVDELAHQHGEVSVFIPCKIDFENRPILAVFEELFLKYHGVLYDKLRNKLGLVYSMNSSFEISSQMLNINFATEIGNIEKCLEIVTETFCDFEKTFKPKKLEELKNVLVKKMEIGSDALTANLYFCQNSLMDYGIFEDYAGFLNRLENVNSEDVKSLYNLITEGLATKKVVIVSKDKAIEELKL